MSVANTAHQIRRVLFREIALNLVLKKMADSEVSTRVIISTAKQCNEQLFTGISFFQISKKLKDIPIRIQSASLKERRKVVEEILNVLSFSGEWRLYVRERSMYYHVVVEFIPRHADAVRVG